MDLLTERQMCINLNQYDASWQLNDLPVNENPEPIVAEEMHDDFGSVGGYGSDGGDDGYQAYYDEAQEDDAVQALAERVHGEAPPTEEGGAEEEPRGTKRPAPVGDLDFFARTIIPEENDAYNYFDDTMMRQFNRPSHWKLRPLRQTAPEKRGPSSPCSHSCESTG